MSELPVGWTTTKLDSLGKWTSGGTPPSKNSAYYGGDIPWVRTGDLRDEELLNVEGRLTEAGLANSAAKIFPEGTLLVAMYGATIGRTGLLRTSAATNQACAALLPIGETADIIPFVWHVLRHKADELKSLGQGGAQPNISQTVLKEVDIMLPPVREQGRIVAKLNSLFARTKAARDDLHRIPLLIEHYKQAILEKAFAGIFAGTRSTRSAPLRSYVASLDQGWSPKCEAFPSDDPEKWAVIKTTAIQPLWFLKSENKVLPSELSPRPHIQIEENDILITRAGPRSRVGVSCLVTESRPKLMLCDKAYRLRAKPGEADPGFVAMMLNAPQALSQIEKMKTGISDSGLNLTQEKLLDLVLPALSLEKQRHTVRLVTEAMSWLDTVGSEQGKAVHLLEQLDQSLAVKAFRGKLVPQDPNDEPAEALLARIRTNRTSQPKAYRGRRAAG